MKTHVDTDVTKSGATSDSSSLNVAKPILDGGSTWPLSPHCEEIGPADTRALDIGLGTLLWDTFHTP